MLATWTLDPAFYGTARSDGYSVGRNVMFRRVNTFHGRPRFRLLDTRASWVVDVAWPWNEEQLAAFQDAWENPLEMNFGAAWFATDLMIGGDGLRTYDCHFIDQWIAEFVESEARWNVSAKLEVVAFPAEVVPFQP